MNTLIDKSNQIIRWPKKPSDKKEVIKWLSNKFEFEREYSEKEINIIIENNHCFQDTPLLRRELVSQKFLDRKSNGSLYWRIN